MKQSNFWQELPGQAISLISDNTHFRHYKKGSVIYSEGESPLGIYIVKKGLVSLVSTSSKGSEHMLRVFSENNFFGHRTLFARETYYARSVCLEESEIGLVPIRVVEQVLVQFPEAARLVIETLAKELGLAENQRLKIADQEVLKRLASSILYLKEIHPNHRWTRNEIAHFCASTGPTIIRGLAELENKGLITQDGRDIHISNRSGLISFAQES